MHGTHYFHFDDVGYSMHQLFVAEKNMSHSGAEARVDTFSTVLKVSASSIEEKHPK